MSTADLIKIGASVVIFILCLVGNIHFKGVIKNFSNEVDKKTIKKKKKLKTLCFSGMLISIWFALGVFITWFSGKHSAMHIEFSMFSDRSSVELFGLKLGETTIYTMIIVLIVTILCLIFRFLVFPKFKDKPEGFQNVIELCVETVENFCIDATGKKAGKSLAPYMFALAIYLVLSASFELFGLRAPTSDLVVTFSMGLITFVLLNFFGFKKLGIGGRFKAMGGPMVAMRPIMIPMKIVSDIAIPISLACRLFGNMLGGMIVMELLKGALGGYAAGIPGIAGLYFNLFHPLIQAYIFITLSLTFIDEAMEGLEEE
ncbi:MAG: F0F1 ATP synthase subunit A [Clostridia bacterium]|nr:F0F1 ATP synthase subunit A [Clostridia bacterium]